MDDQSAIIDIHAGKQAGATYLYNKYSGKLLGTFKNLGLSTENAEDILQETFIRFINRVKKDTSLDNIMAYLFTIGKNECYRFFLINKRFSENEEFTSSSEDIVVNIPSNINIEKEIEFLDCLSTELARFEKSEKNANKCLEILTLVAEAWSLQEIAVKINKKYGATREFLSQCRKKLKSYINHCFDKKL
ncbi:sigma-70 family RNA polymerase sigma factor [Thiotrichales bacterium HSG1]|nr:sigma-70 family RNA polymerase sigma factor [Thiotrichales bacterium HSG1]